MDQAKFNEIVSDECYSIRCDADALDGLARAFMRVGNEAVATELRDRANGFRACQDRILEAWGQYGHDALEKSQRETGELLLAVFESAPAGLRASEEKGGE